MSGLAFGSRARPRGTRPRKTASKEQSCQKAVSLVEEGKYGQGCKALTSPPLVAHDPNSVAALRAKHPPGPAVDPAATSNLPPTNPVRSKAVLESLKAFPKGTGPGPTGLRAQHLVDGCAGPEQTAALEALTDLVTLLADARAPKELAPFLAGAALMALPKDENDLRPVAVGETIRRLTSKCLCSTVREAAQALFAPLQVGVACPRGGEAAVHVVRQYTERHRDSPSKTLLLVDFSNAFNTVDRSKFLAACREQTPGVAAWASWCYGAPSQLVFHETVIESTAGVQQGDNLGPLLFSLALHPLLSRLKDIPGLDIVIGYLDDIALAGDDTAVKTALDLLEAEAQTLGLKLNLEKCVLVPTAGSRSRAQLGAFPAAVKRCLDGNFKFLGAPVGDKEFCAKFTREKRVDKAAALLQLVPELHDGQVAHKLLMHCLGTCKVMYAMRTTRPDWIVDELVAYDSTLRETFESATGLALSGSQWSQATLALNNGGLGLRSAALHASAAYLASRSATWELCKSMDPAFTWEEGTPDDAITAARAAFNAAVPGPNQLPAGPPSSEAAGQQKAMSSKLESGLLQQLLAQAPPRWTGSTPLSCRASRWLLVASAAVRWTGPAAHAPRVRCGNTSPPWQRGSKLRPVVPAVRPSYGCGRGALVSLHGGWSRIWLVTTQSATTSTWLPCGLVSALNEKNVTSFPTTHVAVLGTSTLRCGLGPQGWQWTLP